MTSKYQIEVSHVGRLEEINDSKNYFYKINYY